MGDERSPAPATILAAKNRPQTRRDMHLPTPFAWPGEDVTYFPSGTYRGRSPVLSGWRSPRSPSDRSMEQERCQVLGGLKRDGLRPGRDELEGRQRLRHDARASHA